MTTKCQKEIKMYIIYLPLVGLLPGGRVGAIRSSPLGTRYGRVDGGVPMLHVNYKKW